MPSTEQNFVFGSFQIDWPYLFNCDHSRVAISTLKVWKIPIPVCEERKYPKKHEIYKKGNFEINNEINRITPSRQIKRNINCTNPLHQSLSFGTTRLPILIEHRPLDLYPWLKFRTSWIFMIVFVLSRYCGLITCTVSNGALYSIKC